MRITIIGTGSHAAAVCDTVRAAKEHQVEGLLSEVLPIGDVSCGLKIIGNPHDSKWTGLMSFIAIGDNAIREKFSSLGFHFINVTHPTAQTGSAICRGTYFGPNSFVGNKSTVGNFSIINTGVILEHDSSVGDFTHLAPGVVTGGRVHIGNRCLIGAGAIIRDGITIGDNCIIGMGSVVTKHVLKNSIVWGNPATLQGENKK